MKIIIKKKTRTQNFYYQSFLIGLFCSIGISLLFSVDLIITHIVNHDKIDFSIVLSVAVFFFICSLILSVIPIMVGTTMINNLGKRAVVWQHKNIWLYYMLDCFIGVFLTLPVMFFVLVITDFRQDTTVFTQRAMICLGVGGITGFIIGMNTWKSLPYSDKMDTSQKIIDG
jgi:hypothetical protein